MSIRPMTERTRRYRTWPGWVLLATLLAPQWTAAGQLLLPSVGAPVDFEPPAGYCLLEPTKHMADRDLFATQLMKSKPTGALIAFIYECAALEERRAGARDSVGPYGLVIAPTTDGKGKFLPDVSRSAFLDQIFRDDEKIDWALINNRLKRDLPRAFDDLRSTDYAPLGLVGRDGNAVYHAFITSFAADRRTSHLAGVTATTLANGTIVTFNLYTAYEDTETIAGLLGQQEAFMADFIARNPVEIVPTRQMESSNVERGAFGIDWRQVFLSGLFGGLVAILFTFFWRLFRST